MANQKVEKLTRRLMALITAEQRNARHSQWWYSWYGGDRSPRTTRMKAINKAVNRTEKVAYSLLQN